MQNYTFVPNYLHQNKVFCIISVKNDAENHEMMQERSRLFPAHTLSFCLSTERNCAAIRLIGGNPSQADSGHFDRIPRCGS